jgi:uncharacterized protein (DUF111 family)
MPIPSFSPTANYARVSTLNYPTVTPTVNAVAAAVTYTTAEILSGLLLRDALSSARADLLPTAAAIVAAINGCQVGTSFRTWIRNTGAGAGSITLTTNTGLTLSGTVAIVFQQQKELMFVVTNVTPGSEAVTVYSLGASVAI